MVVVYTPPRPRTAPAPIWLAAILVTFEDARDPQGNRILAAEAPDDDNLREAVERHPHFHVVDYPYVPWVKRPISPEPQLDKGDRVTTTQGEVLQIIELRKMATQLRWSDDDLAGTGLGGDPSDQGGRSPVTGLTLAEMALASPPSDWARFRDVTYPWEHPDFHPPLPGWVPPSAPSKRKTKAWQPPEATRALIAARLVALNSSATVEDVIPIMAATWEQDWATVSTTPVEVVVDQAIAQLTAEASAADTSADTSSELDDTNGDTESEAGPEDETGSDSDLFDPDDAAPPADPAVAAGYPAEHVAAARAIAHELAAKRGTDYHPNALNYLLKNADLPTVGAAELAGLLSIPTT